MKQLGYMDLAGLKVETGAEDRELLGLFSGQQAADRMIMILDGETLKLIPKSALWAKVRAGQIVREQEERDAAREASRAMKCRKASAQRRQFAADRRRKRREDRIRAAITGAVTLAVAVCSGMIAAGTGDLPSLFGVIGALLMASGVSMARKAAK